MNTMKPLKDFFYDPHNKSVQEELNYYSSVLDGISTVGLNLLVKDTNAKDWYEDVPPAMLLRQYIALVDSISTLVKNSQSEPAEHLLRSALECVFLLKFILKDNTRDKCVAYVVANAMELQLVVQRIIQEQGNVTLNSLDGKKNTTCENLLKEYRAILDGNNEMYLRFLSKQKRPNKVPNWYSVYKLENLREVAKDVDMEIEYVKLYSNLSAFVHSGDVISGRMSKGEGALSSVSMIRVPFKANTLADNVMHLSVKLYDEYIKERITDEDFIIEYERWKAKYHKQNKD